jgi:hypothetical protein
MASRSSIVATLALLLLGAGRRDAGTPPPSDPWEFDDVDAPVTAHGEVKDALSRAALERLGAALDGSARLKASAHKNSVGGVTLKLADSHDASTACELYATRSGDELKFEDARCSFPVFSGELRSKATCRHISGTAKRTKNAVLVEGRSSDCTAQPMGLSIEASARVEPVVEVR